MTLSKVLEDMKYLYYKLSAREGKYTRNMNRYNNNGVRRESIWDMSTAPQAYVTPAQGVEGVQTQINLIKSCTDAITSRISQANVRPFFNPVNGSYDTTDACKTAQHFFDIWLDEQHAYPKSVMCFRDAAIFDIGVMHVDPVSKGIRRVAPWEYFLDPAEYNHGCVTRAMIYKKQFPLAGLVQYSDNKELKKQFEDDPHIKGQFVTYYDLYGGQLWQFFEDKQLAEPIKLDFEQYGGLYRRPFVEMFYTKPARGFYSVSLADDLYPIQRQVDAMVTRLDQASRKALLNLILIPSESGLKASNMENGVTAYNYRGGPDGGQPTVMTPPAINAQFLQLLEMYIQKGYQMIGMSELSAQSKKPAGLDSGKALQTMEDIESDRFNTVLQQFVHFLVDVSRVAIDCFPSGDSILPKDIGRGKLSWGDLRKQRDLFTVQFSAATSLSKDPEEKRNEIQYLIDSGLIDKGSVAKFYQLPDLEGVYTLATSAEAYVEKIINNAIRNGVVQYAETVDLQLLKSKALTMMNQLMAAGDDPKYVDNLTELLVKVITDQKNMLAVMNPEAPPPPQDPSALALDAGQIKAISELVMQIQVGLPLDSARAILALSFPSVPGEQLDAIIAGASAQPPAPPELKTQELGGVA